MALPHVIAPSTSGDDAPMWDPFAVTPAALPSPQISSPQASSMWLYTEDTHVVAPETSEDVEIQAIPWTLLSLSPPPPPYLIEGPLSPNGNFQQVSMDWDVGSTAEPGRIAKLVIGGKEAIINNAIQSGFAGTVTYDSINNGWSARLVATVDYWQSAYTLPWTIYMNNGTEAVASGTIIKYVTLPYPDPLVDVEPIFLRAFRFPLQFKTNCDVYKTTDEGAITQNMTLSVMVRLRGIALACHLGSRVPLMPFDPNDVVTRETLAAEVFRAIGIGEPRAYVSTGIISSGDEHEAKVIVPFTVPMKRNLDSLAMSIPIPRLDGGGGRVTKKEPPSYSVPYQPNAVNPTPPHTITEDEDMPSPRITYNNTSSVLVDLPANAMGNSLNYRLSNGAAYPFHGGGSCSLDSSGVNGLDTGSKQANEWYHLYLVVSGDILKPIFSRNDPSTGPSGHSVYLPIGFVFNGNANTILEFDVHGPWFDFRQVTEQPRICSVSAAGVTAGVWREIDLSDASITTATAQGDGWIIEGGAVQPTGFPGFPMDVIDAIQIMGMMDEDSGSSAVYVRGGLAKPTESGVPSWASGGGALMDTNASCSGSKVLGLPTEKLYWYVVGGGTLDWAMRVVSVRHKYRM